MSKRLDDSNYQIDLVGTYENIDKMLPENIISIHRTNNQNELAEIYTASDLFVNPTFKKYNRNEEETTKTSGESLKNTKTHFLRGGMGELYYE